MMRALLQIWYAVMAPKLEVSLMHEKTDENHAFYKKITEDFYAESMAKHPKMPWVRHTQYGTNFLIRPKKFEWYFDALPSQGRQNYRKAIKQGLVFKKIDYDAHLEEITAIRQSTTVRQGKPVPDEYLEPAKAANNPPSLTHYHDYPCFGIFYKDTLVAYTTVFVCGEMAMVADNLIHDDYKQLRALSYLVIEFIKDSYASYPQLKYIFFNKSLSESHYRFRQQFGFSLYQVNWHLETLQTTMFIYRKLFDAPLLKADENAKEQPFYIDFSIQGMRLLGTSLLKPLGWQERLNILLRLLYYRQAYCFYGLALDGVLLSYGSCYHRMSHSYAMTQGARVISDVHTLSGHEGCDYATLAMRHLITHWVRKKGAQTFYIDTHPSHVAMQKVIEKVGFGSVFAEK